jgi:hypothetical protein
MGALNPRDMTGARWSIRSVFPERIQHGHVADKDLAIEKLWARIFRREQEYATVGIDFAPVTVGGRAQIAGFDEDARSHLPAALERYLLERAERLIRAGALIEGQTDAAELDVVDIEHLKSMTTSKPCRYRRADDGGDLWCDASFMLNPGDRGTSSPTTWAECRSACSLRASDHLCSHLSHVERSVFNDPNGNEEEGVYGKCELGRTEIAERGAAHCYVGVDGYPCAERIVVLKPRPIGVGDTAAMLVDQCDALDLAWQVAFQRRLLAIRRGADIVGLLGPVIDSDDATARLTSLASLLDSLVIDDALIPESERKNLKPKRNNPLALPRLRAAMCAHVEADDAVTVTEHVAVLEHVREVRHAIQHADGRKRYAEGIQELGLDPFDLAPEHTWAVVVSRSIAALRGLRLLLPTERTPTSELS